MPRVAGRGVQVAAILLLAAACKGGGDPSADPTTTEPAPVTTPAPATTVPRTTSKLLTDPDAIWRIDGDRGYTPEQREIVRSYIKAEQAIHTAWLKPVDANDPGLLATTTGRHLAQVQKVLAEDAAKGIAKSEPGLEYILTGRLTTESPTRVQIETCYVSDAHRYDIATGRSLESDDHYAIRQLSAMNLVDGAWKLEQQGEVNSWPGALVCVDPLSK